MANNSILKLQVDDKQYEASLKSAQQGLQALQNALRNSGKSFADVDKATEQYVRELGKMDTTAKTTRGRIGEMTSTFVELSRVEKQLTDQERQSPVGKALTESLAQLRQRTLDAKKELQGLENQLKDVGDVKLSNTGGLFGGGKLDGMLQVFGGNLMTKAAGFAASFASEIGSCVQQGIELARQGEGIRVAFERLGRGDILQGLREATHGTVTDLELMKAAVKFNDFKLPVEELGTMLAFAQQKAKDTGQSVDYMVDSIVTGLGRKSLMILDNLGLSATEVKDKMKETGDMTKAVGAIIREQMAKAGDYVETAADRATKANVSLQNKMEELGRKFAPVEEASNQLWTSMKIGILDIIGGPMARLLNGLTEAGRLKNALNNINSQAGNGNTLAGKHLSHLRDYSKSHSAEQTQSLADRQAARYAELENQQWRVYNQKRAQLQKARNNGNNSVGGGMDMGLTGLENEMNEARRNALAWRQVAQEYQEGAKAITTPVKANIDTSVSDPKSLNTTKTSIDNVKGSVADLTDQINKLRKAQSQVTNNAEWDEYEKKIKETNNSIREIRGEIGLENISKEQVTGVSLLPSLKKTAEKDIEKGEKDLQNKRLPKEIKVQDDKKKEDVALTDVMGKMSSGIGQMVSSLEGLGIELPEGMKEMVSGINSVFGVLQAISSIVSAIQAVETITSILPFARGGIVPHAANGYFVPGNRFSGDTTPILANAGELVLNRSQQFNLANQLEAPAVNQGGSNPYVSGENIFLGLNNYLRRAGYGELVTTRR